MNDALLALLEVSLGAAVGAASVLLAQAVLRRRRAAAELSAAALPEGVSMLLDALGSPAIIVDASNNVIKASPGAVLLGLVRGRDLVHAELIALCDRVRRGGAPVDAELELTRGRFAEDLVTVLVRVSGVNQRLLLIMAEDQTEEQRLTQVRRDFLVNISHELKTPIASISVLVEALLAAGDDAEQMRLFARQLGGESARLGSLVKEIIELSRLQSIDALADATDCEIESIVDTAISRCRVLAEDKRITLLRSKQISGTVYGDAELLVTAVQNLIANAIQYSPEGTRVGVGVQRREERFEVRVSDQGPGIPDSERERIFERFYRIDDARTRGPAGAGATGGTGLGLSIVKHIALGHGGGVQLWSKEGEGSTFTLCLPDPSVGATGAIGAVG